MELSRKELLLRLFNQEENINQISSLLRKYPWDIDSPIVTLTQNQLLRKLQLFLDEEIDDGYLIEWANFVELREDIEYEEQYEDAISSVIFELANPEINYKVERKLVKAFIRRLNI